MNIKEVLFMIKDDFDISRGIVYGKILTNFRKNGSWWNTSFFNEYVYKYNS